MTPLHVAVVRHKMEAIKELLELGAKVNARANGLTAVGLAKREGDISMAKFLQGKGGR
jgi:ankyrin repeat protein